MFIAGYSSSLSVAAGDELDFMISTDAETVDVDVVRLIRGGVAGKTEPMIEESVSSDSAGQYPGRQQKSVAGSYVRATFGRPVPFFGVGMAVWVYPTLIEQDNEQVLLAVSGAGGTPICSLSLLGDRLVFDCSGRCQVQSEVPLEQHRWQSILASYDPVAGSIGVAVTAPRQHAPDPRWTYGRTEPATWMTEAVGLAVGARLDGSGLRSFNGKVADPTVWPRRLSDSDVREWRSGGADRWKVDGPAVALDFSEGQSGVAVVDRSGHDVEACCVNMPSRAVTGPDWDGTETSWKVRPRAWSAIHLHDDDVGDLGWQKDVTVRVPPTWRSGAYALRVRTGAAVDRIPFFVRETGPSSDDTVLVLLPTWTYMAYANWRTYLEDQDQRAELYGERRSYDPRDQVLVDHPELGKSLYDKHRDGSGVAYSSRLRPILNMRPDYFTPTTKSLRHFAADLWLLWWLEKVQGFNYAVATDDDLHERGPELLRRYPLVMTGSHPEYVSQKMRGAIRDYIGTGGRVMYLGGNGFYWVTNRHADEPGVIEIRRGQRGGVWRSAPGEDFLSTTGEIGGTWRSRGRYPQELVGVGFRAQGFDRAEGYRRTQASYESACSWIFDGVTGEVFGDLAVGLGGAAGDEIDAADQSLGTSSDAYIVARSSGHSDRIKLSDDETHARLWDAAGEGGASRVRSDIVYWPAGHGAVFSVGSMCWMHGLAWNDADNDVSTITANVVRRFLAPGQLPGSPG